ncbi:MAG: helix-turn-helix domain-containing protein [Kofleriaceae bacterium]
MPRKAKLALSQDRIVEAAIELLDKHGEDGLTFRDLADALATGAGAIYHHVANKDELLDAAATMAIAPVLDVKKKKPAETIRALALAMFDLIDRRAWIGAALSRQAGQGAMTQIYERFGAQLVALGVPQKSLFYVASTLVNYVVGVATQNAALARSAQATKTISRDAMLNAAAEKWLALDPVQFPVMHAMAAQLREHDDRAQFLAGIDLILAGIEALQ